MRILSLLLRDWVLWREEVRVWRPRGADQEGLHRWSSQRVTSLQQTSFTCQTRSPAERKHTFDPLGAKVPPPWCKTLLDTKQAKWTKCNEPCRKIMARSDAEASHVWRRGSLLEPELCTLLGPRQTEKRLGVEREKDLKAFRLKSTWMIKTKQLWCSSNMLTELLWLTDGRGERRPERRRLLTTGEKNTGSLVQWVLMRFYHS